MGRLIEFEMTPWELSGKLWRSVAEDTIVWGQPTDQEKAEAKVRREELLKESAVPWILSDLVGVLQFYDDVQDILAFSRWNFKLFGKKGIRRCMKGQALRGKRGFSALAACLCPLPKRARKRATKAIGAMNLFLMGPLAAILMRMFPGVAPVMYLLLAGQVSATVFGYGIALGPILGASMELFYRGLAEVGAPFGPEHNKYHQLLRARVFREMQRGFGAAKHLGWEDQLAAILGVQMALREAERLPEFVIHPGAYPDVTDIISDPKGVFLGLASMLAAMPPNMAAYMYNDFFPPMIADLSELVGGSGEGAEQAMSDDLKAAMKILERGECPEGSVCDEVGDDDIALEQWGMDSQYWRDNPMDWASFKGDWLGYSRLRTIGVEDLPRKPGTEG